MQRDNTTLIDLYNMINLILDFTEGMTKNQFLEDPKTQAAVLYEIALLGEVTRRLSLEFREQHPEIHYSEIIGMRNKLIHDYQELDLEIVWKAIKNDIPELLTLISPLVPSKNP